MACNRGIGIFNDDPAALRRAADALKDPRAASASGLGVPVATDIALALGVLTLAASRAPVAVRSFLLTLAIVDDIGAVLLIAIFYSGGVHPAVAGVLVGFLIPTVLADRLESTLHPWTSRVVVPLFVLANAGVPIVGSTVEAAISPVGFGVFFGLVVGKPLGIATAVWAATRTGVARLPSDLTPRLIRGAAVLAGIGFTVALFVAELAFVNPTLQRSRSLRPLWSRVS